ncbi:MAG TPA: PfkB family carbohydrate kinase [Candidatus Limnocylindrales bacterium]|nr:PfkB family carbohydrate kinase [Candidatus Limnocylindrales bacterium]
MIERLVAVGHVVEDTAEPVNVIGGGVSYAGIAARNLGLEVQVITKLPEGHRFTDTLVKRGISVLTLPTEYDGITTFTNRYGPFGERKQVLLDRQEDITATELKNIPADNFRNTVFLVASVMGEVDTRSIPYLAKYGLVVVTPQGYFRDTNEDGTVFQREWSGFEEDLSAAAITILSEEDIAIGGIIDDSLLDRITSASPITVLTRGRMGAIVYQGGMDTTINAFFLKEDEIKDFTGAGDSFAAAFIAKFIKSGSAIEAGVYAAFFSAVKIAALSGVGIESIPTLGQLEQFKKEHPSEVNAFLKSNSARYDDLSI